MRFPTSVISSVVLASLMSCCKQGEPKMDNNADSKTPRTTDQYETQDDSVIQYSRVIHNEPSDVPTFVIKTDNELKRELQGGPKIIFYDGPFADANAFFTYKEPTDPEAPKSKAPTYFWKAMDEPGGNSARDAYEVGSGQDGFKAIILHLSKSPVNAKILAFPQPIFVRSDPKGGEYQPFSPRDLESIVKERRLIVIISNCDHRGKRVHESRP